MSQSLQSGSKLDSQAAGNPEGRRDLLAAAAAAEPEASRSHESGPGFRVGHWPFLDGLRGIGVLLVIACHAGLPYVGGGLSSLDVFFVLSGFLITALLLEEWHLSGRICFKDFYVRRALRLLPAVVVFLAALCLYALVYLPQDVAAMIYKGSLATLFYVANLAWTYEWLIVNATSHTWSLSLEEQFYVLWPLLLAGLLRLRAPRRWKAAILAASVVGAIALRVAVYGQSNWTGWLLRAYLCLDTRADGLLMGCLLGLTLSWGMVPRRPGVLVLLRHATSAAGLVLILCLFVPWMEHATAYILFGLPLFALSATLLILGLLHSPPPRLRRALESRAIVWIGRRSYGLYLWHFPLLVLPLPLLGPPVPFQTWPDATALRVALTFAIATASYAWIERPFLRLKGRWSHVRPARQVR